MHTLSAIIVEDELKSQDALRHLLQRFCPEVDILGAAMTVQEAIHLIAAHRPHLVFLDIELPQENGLSLLKYIPKPDFAIIFTTAYDQYAVQAFRLAAVDYLLKPIDPTQLKSAIQKVKSREDEQRKARQLELLYNNFQKNFQKIALPTSNGYVFVEIDQILYCEANRSYSCFYLISGQKILVSKPLKTFEDILKPFQFFRINRSNIINLKYIEKYSRTRLGEVILNNGKVLSVSENKRDAFLKIILNH